MKPKGERSAARATIEKARDDYRNAPAIAVSGGRDFDDYERLATELDQLLQTHEAFRGKVVKFLVGTEEGAEQMASQYADLHAITKVVFPANWRLHPHMGSYLRNEDMMVHATHLIAFWNGRSHSPQHLIELAKERGIPTFIVRYEAR